MQNTLFDYLSASNGAQYLMALGFVAGFLVVWEVLMSPKPFKAIFAAVAEDLNFARQMDFAGMAKKCVTAAAVGGLYLAAIPVLFTQAMVGTTARGLEVSWSPVRAYFTGKKGKSSKKSRKQKK